MESIKDITSIISNLSVFGVFMIAIWALIFKRKEIFRNHLTNRQIDSMLDLRDKLNRIAYDSYHTKYWADNIVALNKSLVDFEREQPEDYKQQKKMHDDLIWLSRMVDQKSFHLFPNDFDQSKLAVYVAYLKNNMQPYSILKFSNLTQEQVHTFQNNTFTLINYIEDLVKKLGK